MTGPASNKSAENVVADLISRAATRTELLIAGARIVVILLLVFRFILINPQTLAWYVMLFAVTVVLTFSITFIMLYHNRPAHRYWLWAAVCIDTLGCFTGLLNNVLNPWDWYTGIIFIPDTAFLLVITFANGFRLNVGLAVFGGLLSLVCAITLVASDLVLNATIVNYGWNPIGIFLIMIVGATAAAMIIARRTRIIAVHGARESVRLERLRSGMKSVLQGHHDAHSLLSSLHLNADQLIRHADPANPAVARLVRNLRDDLAAVNACIQQVKHDSDGQIHSSLVPTGVSITDAISHVIGRLRHSFPGLDIRYEHTHLPLTVNIAGGIHTINRILVNLFRNAAEGNGETGANKVIIQANTSGTSQVTISVEDDGPGLALPGDRSKPYQGKAGGFGVGLTSIENLVQASGGQLTFGRSTLGGTCVRISLPVAA